MRLQRSHVHADTYAEAQQPSDLGADYYLIREPEILPATQKARTAQTPYWQRLKETWNEDNSAYMGKHEHASKRHIEASLGPQIYRLAVKYRHRPFEWHSHDLLTWLGTEFSLSPKDVNNEFASARYNSKEHQAFIRMWFDTRNRLLEMRLHDEARKPIPPPGKKPITMVELRVMITALCRVAQSMYTVEAKGDAKYDRNGYKTKIAAEENALTDEADAGRSDMVPLEGRYKGKEEVVDFRVTP